MKKEKLTTMLSLYALCALGQIAPKNHSIIIKPIFGTHVNNDQGHLFQDKLFGFDAAYYKDISQHKDNWIKPLGAKAYGLGFTFRDLSRLKGAKDTSANSFGQLYGLVGQMDFELFRIGRVKFNFTPGVGLGVTNKNFSNNPKNRFLGSAINETIKADLGLELPLGEKIDFLMGVGFLHVSNGGITVPNGGLNTGNIYVGLKLNNKQNIEADRVSSYKPLSKNTFEFSAGIGGRGVYEKKGSHLYKTGLYAGYNYNINEIIVLKAGADAVYYYTVYNPAKNMETFQNYGTSYDRWRTGLSVGADINLWRLTIGAQLGKYIHYKRYNDIATWYWTFGPTYNITPHFGLQAKTYMHFAQADYINWGFVYRL